MKRNDVYLRHILDAIEKIETYVSVGKKHFFPHSIGKMLLLENWKLLEKRQKIYPQTFVNNIQIFLGVAWPASEMY